MPARAGNWDVLVNGERGGRFADSVRGAILHFSTVPVLYFALKGISILGAYLLELGRKPQVASENRER